MKKICNDFCEQVRTLVDEIVHDNKVKTEKLQKERLILLNSTSDEVCEKYDYAIRITNMPISKDNANIYIGRIEMINIFNKRIINQICIRAKYNVLGAFYLLATKIDIDAMLSFLYKCNNGEIINYMGLFHRFKHKVFLKSKYDSIYNFKDNKIFWNNTEPIEFGLIKCVRLVFVIKNEENKRNDNLDAPRRINKKPQTESNKKEIKSNVVSMESQKIKGIPFKTKKVSNGKHKEQELER